MNGEGLQHEDGHSLLLASTNPATVSYDPAFAYELGYIVRDGLRRMYGENSENIFYYLTVYNEPYMQPAEPENCTCVIMGNSHQLIKGSLEDFWKVYNGTKAKKTKAKGSKTATKSVRKAKAT